MEALHIEEDIYRQIAEYIEGYGLIHYTRNTSGGEFSREFDSLGQCWLEVHTYAEEGYEIINDFNINKLF